MGIEKRPRILLVNRGVIENKKGEILLIRRSPKDPHDPGLWEFPGGKLDQGQDMSGALEREVLEETGLYIKAVEPLCFVESRISSVPGYEGSPYVVIITKAKFIGGKLKLSEEHSDFKWVKPSKALKLNTTVETKKALATFFK